MNDIAFPGWTLQSRREERGLSRADVYARIHVPLVYISALEEGRLEALPVPTYARGFLRTYCQFLELAPEPFVDQLDACFRPKASGRFLTRRSEDAAERPLWLRELITWGAICAVLLLGWFTYAVVVRPLAEDSGVRVEAGVPEAPPASHLLDEF